MTSHSAPRALGAFLQGPPGAADPAGVRAARDGLRPQGRRTAPRGGRPARGDQRRLLHAAGAGPRSAPPPRCSPPSPARCASTRTSRSYLYELAGKSARRPRRAAGPPSACGRPCGGCSTSSPRRPALVLGRRLDILAWNPPPRPCTPTSARSPAAGATTCACCSPTRRSAACTASGSTTRRDAVAALRMEAADGP